MNRTSCMNQNPQTYYARNRRISNPAMGRPVQESGCRMDDCGGNPQTQRTAQTSGCWMENRMENQTMGRPAQPSECRTGGSNGNPTMRKSAQQGECRMENQMDDREMQPELPTGSRSQLLNYINEVSFSAYDVLLFLDTHPDDADALVYFRKYSRMRNAALKEYERLYGPLTLDTASDSVRDSFVWSQQPWPWEGGAC